MADNTTALVNTQNAMIENIAPASTDVAPWGTGGVMHPSNGLMQVQEAMEAYFPAQSDTFKNLFHTPPVVQQGVPFELQSWNYATPGYNQAPSQPTVTQVYNGPRNPISPSST